ncbi:MAG: P-loop NTPase, partial [Candidatus Odinarchaeota archaeon]|nr:P-loop NTPase [Candidatus Odinarchaeota archaeon]
DEKMSKIKHKIVVYSGKGGVGKSTISVQMSLALAHENYKVGIFDADIHGPDVPLLLNLEEESIEVEDGEIIPIEGPLGLKVMSIGFMLDRTTPVIWRGPLKLKFIREMLSKVKWGELDYLIIDLPPGCLDSKMDVLVPDGSHRSISELSLGEMVVSLEKFRKIPHEAYLSVNEVKKIFDMGYGSVYTINTEDGELRGTSLHPILYFDENDGRLHWKPILELKRGELILSLDRIRKDCGKLLGDFKLVEVKSVEYVGRRRIFDVTVGRDHNFISNGFIVHNTGDEVLTIMQSIKNIDGAIIVTTPQEVSILDSGRALSMANKMNVRMLGVVENMSGFICPHCGKKTYIFGRGGGRKLAEKLRADFLGEVPLDVKLRESSDKGVPFIVENPEEEVSRAIFSIVDKVRKKVEENL